MHLLTKSFSVATLVATFAIPVSANFLSTSYALNTPGVNKTLNLPPSADNSLPISLGSAVDPQSGELVEGYAIVHYKENAARPSGSGRGEAVCYGYLGKYAKWQTNEPWVVNATNTRALDPDFILTNLSSNIAKWEDAADGTVGNLSGMDILGDGTLTDAALLADTVSPDDVNEVYFADIADANSIGVTIVWGIFRGPADGQKIVEWDQVYDDVTFDWSALGETGKMDFENIATHELGHSSGLKDIYNTSCSDATMYGYAGEGDTNKRDLAPADITGIDKLY
ncbi:MAG: hypothetical protein A3A97_03525 [Candidatus Terrybacteria bacterium RIFCSPLOWO2_01_FULL_40_23]|uniref:Peptidase M10 metallopeptidase domain-containing protein n=1 Tax=Candidatus Terrybacteria bacterium RIFCSPLOWO2_01_FULL_40_23 TaxID=1802366 RepID=A0A1G2PQ27_9BACT|nr:MAG: hypothetical protein A3A97_03525 [Candidatus Terrybacteria bacterium RIFCSPLOWO2_01_FULL_40_23]